VFKRQMMAALAASVLSVAVAVAAQAEVDADKVLDALAEAMKKTGQAEKKRALLADAAKISSLPALRLTSAAAADKEVAQAALAAAGQIAKTLMAPQQPAYVRRAAFLRWVGCQPEKDADTTVMDALRSSDVVLHSAAFSVVRGREGGVLLEAVAADVTSLPASVQTRLIEVFAARSDAAAAVALVGMARLKDKKVAVLAIAALGTLGGEKALAAVGEAVADADASVREAALRSLGGWPDASALPVLFKVVRTSENEGERGLALRGMAALALAGKPDEAAQATLLKALALVAEGAGTGDSVVAAAQIAQALSASHGREVRQALDAFAARKLSDAARQSVRAALLASTIGQLPNLARGAKASSPDGIESQGPRPDAHAIDGDPATYWDETDGHPLYRLRVEFPKATEVSAISIVGWGHHSYSPRDFEIVCDGKTVKTVTGALYVNNRVIVGLPKTRCTSLELKITGYYGGSPGVRELGIFNAP